jgi:DNA repair protein RecO (recombination protein O)
VTRVTSPGILLRSHPYSESSRILRFLTPGHGVVAVVGKGVRKGAARGGGAMETFQEGTLTWAHKEGRDLHTLTDFQPGARRLPLGRDMERFLGASLVAELLLAHTLEEGDPELYGWVREALARLAGAPEAELPGTVLAAAWRTLAHFGFGPELERCVRCGSEFPSGEGAATTHPRFDVAAGGLRCPECRGGGPRMGPGARRHLQALVRGEVPRPLPGGQVHLRLLERYALHHLGGRRPLRTFSMLAPLMEKGNDADAGSG